MKQIKVTFLCVSIILTIIMFIQHVYLDFGGNNKNCELVTIEELIRLITELLKNF